MKRPAAAASAAESDAAATCEPAELEEPEESEEPVVMKRPSALHRPAARGEDEDPPNPPDGDADGPAAVPRRILAESQHARPKLLFPLSHSLSFKI